MLRFSKFIIACGAVIAAAGCDSGGGGGSVIYTPGEADVPKLVSFGVTENQAETDIKLKNKGSGALAIKSVAVTAGDKFALRNIDNCTGKTIPGYGSCDFTVIFTSSSSAAGGMADGRITITSESETDPTAVIDVYGYAEGSWKPETTAGLSSPGPRYGHSMTADNMFAYVFGGINGTEYKNDLWSVNSDNEWFALSPSQKPEARADGSFINVNGDLYLFGGRSKGAGGADIYYNDIWRYSPSGKNWEHFKEQAETGPEASKTPFNNAVGLGNYIYSIAPGKDGERVKIYRLDVSKSVKTWEPVNAHNSPVLRGNLRANSVVEGKIYIFGMAESGEELWSLDTEKNTFEKIKQPEGGAMPYVGNNSFSALGIDGGFVLFIDNGTDSRMWSYTVSRGFGQAASTGWMTDGGASGLTGWQASYFNKHLVRFGGQYITAGGTSTTGEYMKYE